jgi:hypothetical protein
MYVIKSERKSGKLERNRLMINLSLRPSEHIKLSLDLALWHRLHRERHPAQKAFASNFPNPKTSLVRYASIVNYIHH